MPRVVLDSDDEDAADEPLTYSKSDVDQISPSNVYKETITSPSVDILSGSNSTGSTGKLKHDTEKAHRDLFDSSSSDIIPKSSSKTKARLMEEDIDRSNDPGFAQAPVTLRSNIENEDDVDGSVDEIGIIDCQTSDDGPHANAQDHPSAPHSDSITILSPKPLHTHTAPKKSQSTTKSKKRKRDSHQEDELSRSDEIAIGLPKDAYQPRPSRSRAAKIESDASGSPEPISRRKPKTRKRDTRRAEQLEELVGMGFRLSQADQALVDSEGNMEKAVDQLIGGDKDGESGSVMEDKGGDGGLETKDTVRVVISKTRHSREDFVEDNGPQTEDQAVRSKKKGSRGRPPKSKVIVIEEEETSHENNEPSKAVEIVEEALQTVDANRNQEPATVTPMKEPEQDVPEAGDTSTKTEAEREGASAKPPPRSLAKILQSGYRVGLSKNSRIPSLLRTKGR